MRYSWVLILFMVTIWMPRQIVAENCNAPDGTMYSNVRWFHANKLIKQLIHTMKKSGIVWRDVGSEAVKKRMALQQAQTDKDLCGVYIHARSLEVLFNQVKINKSFVNRKQNYVQSLLDEKGNEKRFKKNLKKINQLIKRKKFVQANVQLSRLFLKASNVGNPWTIPSDLIQKVPTEEIEIVTPSRLAKRSFCPSFQSGQLSTQSEATDLREKLILGLRQRNVYPQDVAQGERLLGIMKKAVKAKSWSAFVAAACSMLYSVKEKDIDLSVVMKKFHRLNNLQEANANIKAQQTESFRKKVRQATDFLSQRRFIDANNLVNELLVILGEPQDNAQEIVNLKSSWE